MGALYPRLALLFQVIFFPAIYMATSDALLAGLQYQNSTTIGQNILNLLDIMTADPDILYHKSMLIVCYTAVDHGDHDPEHFHDYPLSSNISHFRDMRCDFRIGGPIADEKHSYFEVQNRWPLHWDRWGPPSGIFYYPFELLPFSGRKGRKAVSYMSAERADSLLKADGHPGPYEVVGLQKTRAHPDGVWCFLNVQISDAEGGGQRTFVVDVRTGQVEKTRYCNGDQDDWGIIRNLTGAPTADYQ